MQIELQDQILSPYDNFVYALKAKETRRQYPHRLDKFMVFMGLHGTIEEKCDQLFELSKDNNNLVTYLIKFINYQKQRIEKKRNIRRYAS